MLIAFVVAATMAIWTPLVAANAATMYYDCCKPSASWPGKANPVYNPVAVCLADGKTVVTGPQLNDAKSSGCGGGNQFQCSCQQPWTDHANPELGYAFAAMTTQTESENACACYVLDFAGAKPGKVKTLFYQVINTGADVGGGGLDILVPGMGIGLMTQGCPAQFKTDISVWGKQYGGLDHDAAGCHKLPADLQHGCLWRMNEWGDSVNMAGQPRRVKCSQAHIDRTGCQRTDEKNVPSFEQAFASIRHGGDANAAPDRYTPNAAVCGIGHSGRPVARRNYVGANSNSNSRSTSHGSSSHQSSSHHNVVQKQTSVRRHTCSRRDFTPDAHCNVDAAPDRGVVDDRGSLEVKSEVDDDEDNESLSDSEWDALETAAALRREAEAASSAVPPSDPVYFLGETGLSSADYTCPRKLRKTALSHSEPRSLNLVLRIIANGPSKKNGSSKYRLMQVDIGDRFVMDVQAHVGSDLYNVDRKYNPFPEGSIVVMEDVRAINRGRALALDFLPTSRISSPAVSAVAPAAAPRHTNDEVAQAIARLFGGLAPEVADPSHPSQTPDFLIDFDIVSTFVSSTIALHSHRSDVASCPTMPAASQYPAILVSRALAELAIFDREGFFALVLDIGDVDALVIRIDRVVEEFVEANPEVAEALIEQATENVKTAGEPTATITELPDLGEPPSPVDSDIDAMMADMMSQLFTRSDQSQQESTQQDGDRA
ncbi:hypothetical protein PANT_5d00140 [Moesziomyces antarcticus T-34]|uniref:cellulase n=1 Tax=Pseudozyma antarctica (strain T-34) TaxID=1151754 RepID=M9LKH3_PSEA3|nr:hypothetical protein PANT_5d00140 [Moesziomyces antarcticus T-34]